MKANKARGLHQVTDEFSSETRSYLCFNNGMKIKPSETELGFSIVRPIWLVYKSGFLFSYKQDIVLKKKKTSLPDVVLQCFQNVSLNWDYLERHKFCDEILYEFLPGYSLSQNPEWQKYSIYSSHKNSVLFASSSYWSSEHSRDPPTLMPLSICFFKEQHTFISILHFSKLVCLKKKSPNIKQTKKKKKW